MGRGGAFMIAWLVAILMVWGTWKNLKWLISPQRYKIELPEDYEIRKKKKKKEWYE